MGSSITAAAGGSSGHSGAAPAGSFTIMQIVDKCHYLPLLVQQRSSSIGSATSPVPSNTRALTRSTFPTTSAEIH